MDGATGKQQKSSPGKNLVMKPLLLRPLMREARSVKGWVGGCSFSFVGLTQGCFFSLCASFHPFTNSHFKQKVVEFIWCSSWQSDTRSTIVNYDSSIVHMTIKFPTVVIYNRKAFIRLATDHPISLADVRSVFAEQRRTLLNKKECFVLTTISKL